VTRDQLIALNDDLRCNGRGGEILFTPAVYDLEPGLRGRILHRLTLYDRFDPDSLHDYGLLICAGYRIIWEIQEVDGRREMTLSMAHEWLGAAHLLPWNRAVQ
jgi:hypothetical protein